MNSLKWWHYKIFSHINSTLELWPVKDVIISNSHYVIASVLPWHRPPHRPGVLPGGQVWRHLHLLQVQVSNPLAKT